MRWKRINFIDETLVVAETCFMGRFGSPKTRASRREVPLSRAVVEALKAQYSGSANQSPEGLVFATRYGGPFERPTICVREVCNPPVGVQDCQESIGIVSDTLTALSCMLKEHL